MAFLFFKFGILEEIEVVWWDYRMMVVEESDYLYA